MKNKKLLAAVVIVAIVVIVAVGIVAFPAKKASQSQSDAATPATTTPAQSSGSSSSTSSAPASSSAATTTPAPTPTKAAAAPAPASTYKNGTYTTTSHYTSPGGSQAITVSQTIANDAITASTVTSGASDSTSRRHQNDFIAGYKSFVVGKPLSDLQLSTVSGASLTTAAFNSALGTIRAQAKA